MALFMGAASTKIGKLCMERSLIFHLFKKDSQGYQDGATAIYFDWLCVRNGADRYFS